MEDKYFEIEKSGISGKGSFAKCYIENGQLVCNMLGEEIKLEEMMKRTDEGLERYDDPLQIGGEEYLDLEEPYIFINHSCKPNCYIRNKNELVALKDIAKGDELTFDYSLTCWQDAKTLKKFDCVPWDMVCCCGSKNCRKIVTEFYKLPAEKQKYFIENKLASGFILRKFNNPLI